MGRFVLGVTGSIGAGKSTVCRVLLAHGWSVLDVDDVSAEALIEVGPEIALKVPAAFSAAGHLNKEPLFAAMLRDPDLRSDLEKQLRPSVVGRIHDWAKRLTGPGVLDSALLFESGLDELCQATLCVQCSREERRRRVLQRTTASAKHFDALEAAQWPESEKLARAGAALWAEGPAASLEDLEDLKEKVFAALKTVGWHP